MDTKRFDIEENPIVIKEIFATLYHYKLSIIAITTILFTLSVAVNAYFNIILTTSTVGSAKGGISVKRLGRYSNILAISYRDGVPLRAQKFTNTLADAYITQSFYKKTREAVKNFWKNLSPSKPYS